MKQGYTRRRYRTSLYISKSVVAKVTLCHPATGTYQHGVVHGTSNGPTGGHNISKRHYPHDTRTNEYNHNERERSQMHATKLFSTLRFHHIVETLLLLILTLFLGGGIVTVCGVLIGRDCLVLLSSSCCHCCEASRYPCLTLSRERVRND